MEALCLSWGLNLCLAGMVSLTHAKCGEIMISDRPSVAWHYDDIRRKIVSNAIRVHHGQFGRLAVLEMSHSLVVHAHAQAHVLLKIGGSDAHFIVGDERVLFKGSEVVLINSWEPHAYHHCDTNEPLLLLALYLDPLWLAITVPEWGAGRRFVGHSQPASAELLSKARALAERLVLASVDGKYLDIAVLDMLYHIHVVDAGYLNVTMVDRRIGHCVSYMRNHLSEREDLAELGSRFGLSRSHMFYLFQSIYAMPPRVYWNTLRMEHAVDSLRRSDRSIGAIAYDLGFTSQSNFTRFFHNIQGVSPRGYRDASVSGGDR